MSQRIKDLVGNELEFLSFYITGATPGAVISKLNEVLDSMSIPLVKKLCNVSLLAAASNRANVMDYITKPENGDLSRFLRAHYYIQDHVNFSHLNLFGHMLLAGGLKNSAVFVKEFQKRIGAASIWDCNFNKSDLSEAQKAILFEKVKRIPADVVKEPARKLVLALAHKIKNTGPSSGGGTTRTPDLSGTVPPSAMGSMPGVRINPEVVPPPVNPINAGSSATHSKAPIGASEAELKARADTAEELRRREETIKLKSDFAATEAAVQAAMRKKKLEDAAAEAERAAKAMADALNPIIATPISTVIPEESPAEKPSEDVTMEDVQPDVTAAESKDGKKAAEASAAGKDPKGKPRKGSKKKHSSDKTAEGKAAKVPGADEGPESESMSTRASSKRMRTRADKDDVQSTGESAPK